MKKKVLTLLTAGMLLASGTAVHAENYTEHQQRIADALYHVELFRGTNNGYQLGRELTRAEGVTLLVRMLGQEDAAMNKTYDLPFTDVDDWAIPYVGYAYENGITNGVSDTQFGSQKTMTDYMFITLTLRALGYSDKGEAPQFVWNDPYVLANGVGLIDSAKADDFFTRGDAVEVFWNALAENDYAMAKSLRDRGVFTAKELEEAIEISLNGKKNDTSSSIVLGESSSSVVTGGSDDSLLSWEDFEWEDWEVPEIGGGDNDYGSDLPEINNSGNDDSGNGNGESDNSETDNNVNDDKPADSDKNENNGDGSTEGGLDIPSAPEQEKPNEPEEPEKEDETTKTPEIPEGEITYEMYLGMSGDVQEAYMMSFDNIADFFVWLNTAKAEYEKLNPSIEIGGNGSINIGDIIGKENNGG